MICFFLFKKSFFMASWLHGYEVAKGKPVISIDVVTNTGFWFTFALQQILVTTDKTVQQKNTTVKS